MHLLKNNNNNNNDTIVYPYYYTDFIIKGESYGAVAYKANKLFDKLRRQLYSYANFGEWRSLNC
jgi:hypothetical protein